MKQNKLIITIEKSVEKVFEFATNPKNTPLWIEHIKIEKSNSWPIKIGTIYENMDESGLWTEYLVTALIPNKLFELTSKDNNYCVRYSFKKLTKDVTEMEYFEWVKNGELDKPFTQDVLEKLKNVIEKK